MLHKIAIPSDNGLNSERNMKTKQNKTRMDKHSIDADFNFNHPNWKKSTRKWIKRAVRKKTNKRVGDKANPKRKENGLKLEIDSGCLQLGKAICRTSDIDL